MDDISQLGDPSKTRLVDLFKLETCVLLFLGCLFVGVLAWSKRYLGSQSAVGGDAYAFWF